MSTTPEPKYKPPLRRGEACTNCRKRKVACNGDRSGCNQCLKSQKVRKYSCSPIICSYSSYPRKSKPKFAELEEADPVEPKIARLEERIAVLETQLMRQEELLRSLTTPGMHSSSSSTSTQPSFSTIDNHIVEAEMSGMHTTAIIGSFNSASPDPAFLTFVPFYCSPHLSS
ncbi:hypothetical protein BT69DRAFT_1290839 [Atractiella rhizophila]|nr:hypothetical protein BT69DRAFT_1290839 [Atractiella rhizophila]